MRKQIDIDVCDLEDNDTVCGYRIKDVVAMARILQKENISVIDLRKCMSNLEFAYKMVLNDMQRSFNEQMLRFRERASNDLPLE